MNKIVWTSEKSNRLYDYVAHRPQRQTEFFGYQVNEAIFNISNYFIDTKKKFTYLDYACGAGHILERFLKQCKKADIYGVDMSPECVSLCKEKLKKYSNLKGIEIFTGDKLPLPNDFFDFITATEVVEHLLPEHKDIFYSELYRILKPGGILFITTPNEEDFSQNEIYCPACDTLFHKYGHCNWFSKEILTKQLEYYGYKTIICENANLWKFQISRMGHGKFYNTMRYIFGRLLGKARSLIDPKWDKNIDSKYFKSRCGKGNNLFWIGRKNNEI